MNNNFNWNRFKTVVRYDIAVNKKLTVVFFLVTAFALFSVHVFSVLNAIGRIEQMRMYDSVIPQYVYGDCLDFSAVMSFICYWLVFVVGGSFVFYNMRSKQQRIGFLVQPATYLEKFIARVLWVTVVLSLAFLAAVMFADVLRLVFCRIINFPAVGSVTMEMLQLPSEMQVVKETMRCYYLFTMWLTLLMLQSVYVFAGSLLRRNQWAVTTIVVIALILLWGYWDFEGFDYFMPTGNVGFKALLVLPVQLGVTVLCYWRAYKTFCGMQVINNKWINV